MLEAIRIVFRRITKARDVQSALSQVVSPRMVALASSQLQKKASLLEYVAQREELDSGVLLEEVAERLGMDVVDELHFPPAVLLEKTGYPLSTLREMGVIPQHSATASGGYMLVVADPSTVSVEDFQVRGIPVRLALASRIEKIWQSYHALLHKSESAEVADSQLFDVLAQLAVDAKEYGASEVFVGHPNSTSYEFLVGANRYTGKIHNGLYQRLLEQFKSRAQFSYRVTSSGISEVSASLTKNFQHPVVYLSWLNDTVDEVESQPEVQLVAQTDVEKGRTSLENTSETKVLLVDDDSRFASVLISVLEKRGYAVSYCDNGIDALELLVSDDDFDVIISDVHMPKMDGLDFVSSLRRESHQIPILVLTSDEDELIEVELVRLGADAFVRKQDDVRILFAWLKNLAARRTAETRKHGNQHAA